MLWRNCHESSSLPNTNPWFSFIWTQPVLPRDTPSVPGFWGPRRRAQNETHIFIEFTSEMKGIE